MFELTSRFTENRLPIQPPGHHVVEDARGIETARAAWRVAAHHKINKVATHSGCRPPHPAWRWGAILISQGAIPSRDCTESFRY